MQIFVCKLVVLLRAIGNKAATPKQCLSATGTTKMLQQAGRIMKLTAVLLLGVCMQIYAAGYGQKITLSERDVPIEKVLKKIQAQTSYKFLYTSQLLSGVPRVTVVVKDATVQDVLDLVLKGQMLDYEVSDETVVIKPRRESPGKVVTQLNMPDPIEVRGVITDENGAPAAGVNVMVKGTSKGTTTNLRGEFVLRDVSENAVLLITSVGYDRQEILVKGKAMINTQLRVAVGNLDEMQVIAYGTTSKRFNTGNVSTVKSSDIEKQPVSNPILALQGRIPGMEIVQANGLPGSGVTVRIRGQNSINNGNDPLYVVDGVSYQSQMLPGLFGAIIGNSGAYGENKAAFSGSPLSYINPGDIESIDVLKDADATAIYGSRGANGVVLITTKKGKPGPMRVDVNVQQGWSKVTRFVPWLNTRQYLDMRYEAYRNDGIDISTLTPSGDNYDLTLWDTTRYTDWNRELIGGTGKFSNIQLALNGGNNNVAYRIGYNYNKQTTVFPGSFGDPKGTLSFNVNSSSNNKKLNVQLSGNYQVDKNELPNYDLSEYTNLPPNAPALYNGDGSLNWAPNPANGRHTWRNPLAYLNAKYKRKVNNLITNAVLSYELLPGLEVKANAGYSSMQSKETQTSPLSVSPPINRSFIKPSSRFANTQNDTWIIEPQVAYKKKVSFGEFSFLIGTTIQQNNSDGQEFWAREFNSDLVLEDIKAANSVQVESSLDAVYKYNAVFGRVNYNYNNKYIINFSARRDGTSRFGPDKQFANFGATALAWVFSKEKFIAQNLPFLSFGKLRASYGTTGSDQVGDYRFLDLYRYVNYAIPYQSSFSLVLNGLFNADLAWEETKKFEVAMEMGLFQDRIYVSSSFFRNRSSNQLISYQLPLNTGAPSVPANLDATVENTGWELTMNTINVQTKNLRWTSSINLTIPRNKLISLSPQAYTIDKRLVGRSLNTQFVFSFAGVDPSTGQYQFYDGKGATTFRPDTAYDPVLNRLYSQHALNINVEYYGGFQNSILWRDIQLDFLFQFEKRIGQTNFRGSYPGSFSTRNQPVSVLGRWQKAGDNAPIQRYNQDFSIYNSVEFLNVSDANYMDASFLRLKNISFSWQLPRSLKQKMHLQNMRVYTQAQNLFVISNYKGSDPETRSLTSLPPLRTWTIGLQLTL